MGEPSTAGRGVRLPFGSWHGVVFLVFLARLEGARTVALDRAR